MPFVLSHWNFSHSSRADDEIIYVVWRHINKIGDDQWCKQKWKILFIGQFCEQIISEVLCQHEQNALFNGLARSVWLMLSHCHLFPSSCLHYSKSVAIVSWNIFFFYVKSFPLYFEKMTLILCSLGHTGNMLQHSL